MWGQIFVDFVVSKREFIVAHTSNFVTRKFPSVQSVANKWQLRLFFSMYVANGYNFFFSFCRKVIFSLLIGGLLNE